MNHLIINRDYPPSSYQPGGIGTYVAHIARLLAEHGETVHVITQRWPGAARAREERVNGRLVVHRVSLDDPLPQAGSEDAALLRSFRHSVLPVQAFAWQAARLAESLIDAAAIDVIEAQEYEAPLYFLLLRRALGLSTCRPAPAVVHLHTGTEFVVTQNRWDLSRPDCLAAKRLEDYTIRAADALLCPSRFLAGFAQRHYQLDDRVIEVIPYPIGATPVLPRTPETWRSGTICYVGRLEPRKGVVEWVDAAVAVARADVSPRFTLIGGDVPFSEDSPSTRAVLLEHIPADLADRFTFVDFVPRNELARHLEQACMAVVPSRWENFPNACIEAMSSGLPVLASPTGGMAEMIDDGRTGWIAAGRDRRSLETALRRALATPADALARMGAAAAAAIRVLCDNERTVERQLEFRRRVAKDGARRSTHVASASTFVLQRPAMPTPDPPDNDAPSAVAVVVTTRVQNRAAAGIASAACIASITAQSEPPAHVAVSSPDALADVVRRGIDDWHPLAIAIVDGDCVLAPSYVAAIRKVFTECPVAGIMTPWLGVDDRTHTGLPPAFPFQWAWNDVGPCAAFRVRAIADAGGPQSDLGTDDMVWALSNAILARGWVAVAYPAALATVREGDALERTRAALSAAAAGPPASGRTITVREALRATPQLRHDLARRAVANPRYALRWLAWHARRTLERLYRPGDRG